MTLPASIPLRRDSPTTMDSQGIDMSGLAGLGLLLVIGIFAVALWHKYRGTQSQQNQKSAAVTVSRLARLLGAPQSDAIVVLANKRLTAQHSLHEVQWQGRHLLIGCAGQSISVLAQVPQDSSPLTGSTPQGTHSTDQVPL